MHKINGVALALKVLVLTSKMRQTGHTDRFWEKEFLELEEAAYDIIYFEEEYERQCG